MFVYTDESYISEFDELQVLSRHYSGPKTHEMFLEALSHAELFIHDKDAHGKSPDCRTARCRIYSSALHTIRVEADIDIHDVSSQISKQINPKL